MDFVYPINKAKLLLLLLLLMGCAADDDLVVPPIMEDPEEVVPVELLSAEELSYIRDLLIVEQEINTLWPSFIDLRESPIYIITGEDQGIFINPMDSQLLLSTPITHDIEGFESLSMYRNDLMYQFARTNIPVWRSYDFNVYAEEPILLFDISRDLSVVGFYTEYKNRFGYYDVSILFHELFHLYSVFGEARHDFLPSGIWEYDFDNYPLTEETLPYLLLLFDVMIDGHLATNYEAQRELLSYYVAIQSELETVDPSEGNLIRNHGFYYEKVEGAARYLEVFGTLNSLNNNTVADPTHGFADYANQVQSSVDVQQIYGFRIFYHTGAGAIHLLQSLGYNNLDEAFLIPSNTPYDIAKDFLSLSDIEKEQALEHAKLNYDWDGYLDRAAYLLSL